MGCWSKPSRLNIPENSIEVELKIWMHCENCAKDVKKAISKFEGVEACRTDMGNQKVMVTGKFNLEKLLKNLKKKTGKKAEILTMNEKDDMIQKEDDEHDVVQVENDEHETITEKNEEDDIVQKNNVNPKVEEKIDKPETSTKEVEIHMAFLCEKYEVDIGKVISKFEGVKTCMVDVENQKVVITGEFDKEKLLKKLKKKMRKRINNMEKKRKGKEPLKEDDQEAKTVTKHDQEIEVNRDICINPNRDDEKEMDKYMMFSDENPNACSIS